MNLECATGAEPIEFCAMAELVIRSIEMNTTEPLLRNSKETVDVFSLNCLPVSESAQKLQSADVTWPNSAIEIFGF